MSTLASAKFKAILFTAIALGAAVVAVYFGLRALNAPPSRAAAAAVRVAPVAVPLPPFVDPRDEDHARQSLMLVPEVKAWSDYLERASRGTVHGLLVRHHAAPVELDGKRYWLFSFVESTPDAARRSENFLVGENTAAILVDDVDSGKRLTLDQWRATKQPLKRMSAPLAPAPAPAAAAPAAAAVRASAAAPATAAPEPD